MNRDSLMKILPHRGAMLLLDSVVLEDKVARGEYRFRGDEWFLLSYLSEEQEFKGQKSEGQKSATSSGPRSAVPGVILCEILAQSVCPFFQDENESDSVPFFAGMDKICFLDDVLSGDRYETECRLKKAKKPFYFFQGIGRVDGRVCITADFSIALLDKEQAKLALEKQ